MTADIKAIREALARYNEYMYPQDGKGDYHNVIAAKLELSKSPEWLRQLLDENESLSQRLKDYEGCKGVEDYYRVLWELREARTTLEQLKREP